MSPEEVGSRIIKVLNNSEIGYWLDSGTLLGLMRDGRLLPGDRDLDIGIWEEDLTTLPRLEAAMRRLNYRARREYYRNQLFNVTFMHRWARKQLRLDIYVFRRVDEYAWAPLIVPRDQVVPGLDWMLKSALRAVWARGISILNVDSLPWSRYFDVGTWLIPAHLIGSGRVDDTIGARVPEHWADYLGYRYGDWKTPVSKWHFWEHDGGVRRQAPDDVLAHLDTR